VIKIYTTNYINALPFIHGIKNSPYLKNIRYELILTTPYECAVSYFKNKANFVLLPSGATSSLVKNFLPFGIVAQKNVDSVLLLSNCNISDIELVFLDSESITSKKLLKILLEKLYGKKNIIYVEKKINTINKLDLKTKEAILMIGDKAILNREKYTYSFDLAELWYKMTNKPFVFAYWVEINVDNKNIKDSFVKALFWGIENKFDIYSTLNISLSKDFLKEYLGSKIKYLISSEEFYGLKLFYKYMSLSSGF